MADETDATKRILVVAHHNAFREALAMRLNQEEDLEVAWQAGSITCTRNVHFDPAVYQKALGAGAAEVLATNTGIEEVIDAVRRSAAAEEEEW